MHITPLGLVEMTRQRAEESIRETTYSDCPYCHGRGKVKSALSMSVEIQRRISEVLRRSHSREQVPLRIVINPAVLERLRKEDEKVLMDLQKQYNTRLSFVPDSARHMEEFVILHAESGKELYHSKES